MSKLTKTQIEFKKQMQELESKNQYKEIINDHNSFYNNKAYEIEIEINKEKKKKNTRRIIYLLLIAFISISIYKNIDKIDFDKIKANIEKSKIAVDTESKNSYNNYNYTDNDIKQYEVAMYIKNYRNNITSLIEITKNLINDYTIINLNVNELNNQLNIINNLIIDYENMKPVNTVVNIHEINLETLYSLKNLYECTLLYNANTSNNELMNNFFNSFTFINENNVKYRESLINTFKSLNMSYSIDENNNINFTYKDIKK